MLALAKKQGVVVVDGGLATQLEAEGHDLNHHLWSARLLLTNQPAIQRVHAQFLDAGADVIISSTYQATVPGFERVGIARDRARDLIADSVRIAAESRDQWWAQHQADARAGRTRGAGRERPLVAASMGCYGASLADGSEYKGNYGKSVEFLADFHRQRIKVVVEGVKAAQQPDVWAFETVPCAVEAEAITLLLSSEFPSLRAWIAFSCNSPTTTCGGDEWVRCVRLACACEQVVAVGLNCTAPRHVRALVEAASPICRAAGKLLVIYPNSGEVWDGEAKQWHATAHDITDINAFAKLCLEWRDAGANVIGGCCRTTPRHIAALRRAVLPAHANL